MHLLPRSSVFIWFFSTPSRLWSEPLGTDQRRDRVFFFLNLYKKGVEPITFKSITITFKSTQIPIKKRAR